MNSLYILVFAILISVTTSHGQDRKEAGFVPSSQPVFRVDYSSPTADKPQSKLWYEDGYWWAILPRSSGPSLWQRTNNGWKEHNEVYNSLKGIPGRADVWADEGKVTAISVGESKLVVFRLIKIDNKEGWKWDAKILAHLPLPVSNCNIETATIVKDANGAWWVAADINEAIYVWYSSSDAKDWSEPLKIGDGIKADDICVATDLTGGIGIIWSNQNDESLNIRIHDNGDKMDDWSETEIIESGNSTADDHLNTALSPDGTLWLVTKNSVDKLNKPQLVLRVRLPHGKWLNYPYAILGSIRKPSRPIIVSTNHSKTILAGHTIYNSEIPELGEIVFGTIDTTKAEVLTHTTPVISPNTTGLGIRNLINDPTGPKKPYPKNVPWIILASDREGQVYEADLSQLHSLLKGENSK